MENLIITRTELSPAINFDATRKTMLLNGRCVPENAHAFFAPLIDWVVDLFNSSNANRQDEYIFSIDCDYYNSASAKMFYHLFHKIAEIQKKGFSLKVVWRCHKDDPEMIESVKDYSAITGADIDVEAL